MKREIEDYKFWNVNFRGHDVLVTDIRVRAQIPKELYVYQMRHDDDGDWTLPITIEYGVLVNNYGTMLSKTEIDLGEDGRIYLADDESEEIGYNQTIMKTVKDYLEE